MSNNPTIDWVKIKNKDAYYTKNTTIQNRDPVNYLELPKKIVRRAVTRIIVKKNTVPLYEDELANCMNNITLADDDDESRLIEQLEWCMNLNGGRKSKKYRKSKKNKTKKLRKTKSKKNKTKKFRKKKTNKK